MLNNNREGYTSNMGMNKKLRNMVLLISVQAMFIGTGCSYRKSSTVSSMETNIETNKDSHDAADYKDETSEVIITLKNKHIENVKNNILTFTIDDKAQISHLGMKYDTDGNIAEKGQVKFENAYPYSDVKGVTCFRGNNRRDGASFGAADVKEEKIEIVWRKNIGSIDEWSGVGWNGQPAIVQWDEDVMKDMNINADKKSKVNLKEVLYATLDGNVYFLDLEDGKETRQKLNIGAPIKGSLSVDPRGIPLLYVGQGINKNGASFVDFAYRIFSLTNFSKLYEIKGSDSFAKRDWGAFDSTLLVDKNNDTFILGGENGLVYSGKLNTKYVNGNVEINPKVAKYRYDVPGMNERGIENSVAVYNNYGYFADNDGILQCLDLNTFKPMWALNVNDDTDSTIVLEKEQGSLSLYTASEVDHQGANGYSYVRKIDGTSGKILWENKYKCAFDPSVNGGALATPVLGKGDIEDVAIFNIARTPSSNGGRLVALDKRTGKEVWNLELKNYCWSSPVAIYTKDNKSYIIQCDSAGKAMLIEGTSGRILDTVELGANVEGSPAAFDNHLVVGTRGCQIVGFKVK